MTSMHQGLAKLRIPPSSSRRTLRVLVVEDQPVQLALAGSLLRRLGVGCVYESLSGDEALQIAHERDPDIALLDLHMPGMDGMELLRRLALPAPSPLSVILVSSVERKLLHSVATMAEAYGLRVLGVIEKPLTAASLEAALSRYREHVDHTPSGYEGGAQFSFLEIESGIANGEFEAFLQPKISIATRKLVGAEALARWHHPTSGVLGPAYFIPVLEKSGNLDALTFCMLKNAANVSRKARLGGLDIALSVNLSLTSLTDTSIADRITACVHDAGAEPSCLVLEITETAAMTEVAPALENLARLRMRGFGLAVDDYGTGFSSLRQLTRVPFTELKIDRSFVTGCARSSMHLAIVESSLAMARKLEMTSTAEGVEREAEMALLKTLGCDHAQGFLVDRAMDERRFLEKYGAGAVT